MTLITVLNFSRVVSQTGSVGGNFESSHWRNSKEQIAFQFCFQPVLNGSSSKCVASFTTLTLFCLTARSAQLVGHQLWELATVFYDVSTRPLSFIEIVCCSFSAILKNQNNVEFEMKQD